MPAPNKPQPTKGQREMLRLWMYDLGLNFNKLAKMKMFYRKINKEKKPRSPQQFQMAFAGQQPTLMNAIAKYIRSRMSKRNGVRQGEVLITNQNEVG